MKFCLIVFTLFTCLMAASQDRKTYIKDSTRISNCQIKIIQLPPTFYHSATAVKTLPFSRFSIKDVRADTSTIGVQVKTESFSPNNYYRKLQLDKPVSQSLAHYLNSYPGCTFSSSLSLALFIKELRLIQKDSLNKNTNAAALYNKITFEAEAYLVTENVYHPAFKIDIAFLSLTANKNEFSALTQTFDLIVQKAVHIDTGIVFSRKKYTAAEIATRYEQRFNKPILTAKQLNPGIYKNFADFVNNNPSTKEYSIKADKKSTNLYTKTGEGEWNIETKAYGFCDGTIIWLNINNTYRPLVRIENTFEFLGDYYNINYRAGARYNSATLPAMPYLSPGVSMLGNAANDLSYASLKGKIVHQLNMETGEFY